METAKTHWRKNFDYRFISGEEIQKPTTLKIKEIKTDKAFNGKKEDTVNVVIFEGAKKGMILNRTNAKAIAQVTGSPFIEDWPGKEITLVSREVSAFGTTVQAVRVKVDSPNLKV